MTVRESRSIVVTPKDERLSRVTLYQKRGDLELHHWFEMETHQIAQNAASYGHNLMAAHEAMDLLMTTPLPILTSEFKRHIVPKQKTTPEGQLVREPKPDGA